MLNLMSLNISYWFCEGLSKYLRISLLLIVWVNSFVVQLNDCIVDDVYQAGNIQEVKQAVNQ